MEKYCKRCKKTKDAKDFYKSKAHKLGLSYCCKLCSNVDSKGAMQKIRNTKEGLKRTNLAVIKHRLKNPRDWHKYETERGKVDIHFRIKKAMARAVRQKLKYRLKTKNGDSCFDNLPYTVMELKRHLEEQFTKGMSWKNYGLWHIDHVKPDSLFCYKSMQDDGFRESWALANLQPLWAEDNLKKSNKFTK